VRGQRRPIALVGNIETNNRPTELRAPCCEAAAAADAGLMHAKRQLDWSIGESSQNCLCDVSCRVVTTSDRRLFRLSECTSERTSRSSLDAVFRRMQRTAVQRLAPRYHWPLRIDRYHKAIKATSSGALGPSRIRTQPAAKSRHVRNSLTIIRSRLTPIRGPADRLKT
jgi:hypothetical protein